MQECGLHGMLMGFSMLEEQTKSQSAKSQNNIQITHLDVIVTTTIFHGLFLQLKLIHVNINTKGKLED